MTHPIIEIKNLSKKYRIVHEQSAPHASLKEILSHWIKKPFKRGASPQPFVGEEEFVALQGIHLEIKAGDRVALLGRNGAGKSTLLKILARITEPTSGSVTIRGRVSSLLEVGTGFHPDLTGRENIFLNGAIMGLSYKEIKAKFDEIVAFADIERFLDTPVKRYSSGMFMRLGFAIAAHLDSDLLILDEVLAVGDQQFQEKCLGKINEIGSKGNTILFVSHNVHSVLSLCNKGVFLEKGELKGCGPIKSCLDQYLSSIPLQGLQWEGEFGNEAFRLRRFSLEAPAAGGQFYVTGEKTTLQLDGEWMSSSCLPQFGFTIFNERKAAVAHSTLPHPLMNEVYARSPNHFSLSFPLDFGLFHPGEYQIRFDCHNSLQTRLFEEELLLNFTLCSQDLRLQKTPKGGGGISLGNAWRVRDSG